MDMEKERERREVTFSRNSKKFGVFSKMGKMKRKSNAVFLFLQTKHFKRDKVNHLISSLNVTNVM